MDKEKYALGVDIGGTNIKLGIVSDTGEIIFSTMVPTNREGGPDEVMSQLKKGIKETISQNELNIIGIGIGAAGSVSSKNGTVSYPPNIPGWDVVNVVDIVKKEFNLPVFIDNDANAAAIGEMLYGAGKEFNSFALVTLGTGVGGGLILNRKIYQGDFGAAGELGHISIDYEGRLCKCGSKGCVEAYVGNHYLVDIVKEELPEHKGS
ncbi:MAG: ROK family protein, partial [Bacteroidetes bacterium]|nr:ROK family protein [Bacteroidota bacterium]